MSFVCTGVLTQHRGQLTCKNRTIWEFEESLWIQLNAALWRSLWLNCLLDWTEISHSDLESWFSMQVLPYGKIPINYYFFFLKITLSKYLCNKVRFGWRYSTAINKIAFPTFPQAFFQFYCLLMSDFSARRQVSPFFQRIFLIPFAGEVSWKITLSGCSRICMGYGNSSAAITLILNCFMIDFSFRRFYH